MRSMIGTSADSEGTKEPQCAISTIIANCRRYVDFPAMFGPVSTIIFSFGEPRLMLFGTNSPALIEFSTTGCLPDRISIFFLLLKVGLEYEFLSAISANPAATSITATTLEICAKSSSYSVTKSNNADRVSCSKFTNISCVTVISFSSVVSGGKRNL